MTSPSIERLQARLASGELRPGTSLSEQASLELLAAAGIDVVRSSYARTTAEALAMAEALGYPLVLKGMVPAVAHKTERGLVHPFIRSAPELERAIASLPTGCEGFLLEELVDGIRELVLGIVRDPTFGPTVLVGFGGVHSELIADTTFVLAPVDDPQARAALGRLRSARMLGSYRGQAPADTGALVAMMRALGELALGCPEIRELDLNPVIVRRDGRPIACSALVVL